MARHGIDYESVKQAASKLLIKGISPSVQKIRELLGTGSNTTIAEHLKFWREQQALKKIHHLPATIPNELVTVIETLWQTAMERAEKQMEDTKNSLDAHEKALRQEKILLNEKIVELNKRHEELSNKLDEEILNNKAVQTKLTVAEEKLQHQFEDKKTLKEQYELRFNNLLDEKHDAIEKVNHLQAEIKQLQQTLLSQSDKHQLDLGNERKLYEKSESRWMKLIDEARTQVLQQKQSYQKELTNLHKQIKLLNTEQLEHQKIIARHHATMEEKTNQLTLMTKQHDQIYQQFNKALEKITVLQTQLNKKGYNTPPKAKKNLKVVDNHDFSRQ